MTYDEIVDKIKKFYGLELFVARTTVKRVELEILSPTGKRLLTILLFMSGPDNWEWAGCHWNTEVPALT